MEHSAQVGLIRSIFAAIDRGMPPMAQSFTRNDPSAYTSKERAAREREVLFRRHPIVAGFASQAANPGDYFTDDLGPVPTLVVRGEDGELRAFANVCRHRGAKLAQGCGVGAKRFTCPYHAWSYDTRGKLAAIPDDDGFAGLDRESNGMVELPAAARHGLVWVSATPSRKPITAAVDELIGGLGGEIDSYGIPSFVHCETRIVHKRVNWKIMSDTFWEAYHIKVLHRENVAPLFIKNLAMFEPFGRSHRYVGVRRSIEKLRAMPEAKWDLLPHATILMNLFPNTILVMQSDHAEAYRIFPSPERVGASAVAITILAPAPSPHWSKVMDLLTGVVEQDFTVGEGIQRNFEAGVIRHVNYGRYENALEHFHSQIREALAESR
ncbi:MAG TPA: aromatic ring-hydroxylating dioxygenase subunit alpha [Candidatus Binataceae bacterium]|nr:aromatic ring-hydroxylating dioxygenase subunit alpha [Candidatus Binataceae bacterium]